MKLTDFLEKVGGKEDEIIEYTGKKALEAVKQTGYSLQYVKEQTGEICLEAVKQTGDSLRYVNKSIFSRTRIIIIDKKEIEISEESYKSFKEQFKN